MRADAQAAAAPRAHCWRTQVSDDEVSLWAVFSVRSAAAQPAITRDKHAVVAHEQRKRRARVFEDESDNDSVERGIFQLDEELAAVSVARAAVAAL